MSYTREQLIEACERAQGAFDIGYPDSGVEAAHAMLRAKLKAAADMLRDHAAALKQARREALLTAAAECERIWVAAPNTRPEYRQNEISHGCIASARAIRALLDAGEAGEDADVRAGFKHAYALSRARHAALLQAASAMCDFCRQSIPATRLRSGDYRHVYEERFCHAAAILAMIEREFGGANEA